MDVVGRAYVDAARRLGRDQDQGFTGELARHDELLDVPAGQVLDRRVEARGLDGKIAHEAGGVAPHPGEIEEDALGEGRARSIVQEDILLHAEIAYGAVAHPFLGDVGHTRGDALVERRGAYVPAARADCPRQAAPHSGEALGELALTVARDAGQADDLSRVYVQIDVLERLGAAIAHRAKASDLEADGARRQRVGPRFP